MNHGATVEQYGVCVCACVCLVVWVGAVARLWTAEEVVRTQGFLQNFNMMCLMCSPSEDWERIGAAQSVSPFAENVSPLEMGARTKGWSPYSLPGLNL